MVVIELSLFIFVGDLYWGSLRFYIGLCSGMSESYCFGFGQFYCKVRCMRVIVYISVSF
ncbi:hypothetical protein L211DRAFT_94298 [Terfezia boudieri ATCC MYA-4762]|uniref:Uncharacterized protein n=1 Tax=Terfezia boudieri ATCC MYA-4762 TaxID=1051890 RepID=A0A3N4M662_9PEZI|nr:hypothetical protein L211DRAFT_94298 [Terfezia boudieri ATCC MYA-4762]